MTVDKQVGSKIRDEIGDPIVQEFSHVTSNTAVIVNLITRLV